MKGKIQAYFDMPNVGKFRSRVANPSQELTAQLRGILTQAVVETVNENVYGIRAKFIKAVEGLGIEYTSEAHKAKVQNVLESFFDVYASVEKIGAEKGDENSEPNVEPTDDKGDWE